MNSPLQNRILEEFEKKFRDKEVIPNDDLLVDIFKSFLLSTITQVEAETLERVLAIIDAVYVGKPDSEDQVVPYEIKKIVAKEVCTVLRERIEALRQTK